MTNAQKINRSLYLRTRADEVEALLVKVGEHLKRMGVWN